MIIIKECTIHDPQPYGGLLMAPKEKFAPDLEMLLDTVSTPKPHVCIPGTDLHSPKIW
jgi:hypothetical protein